MSERFWRHVADTLAGAGCGAVFGVPSDEPGLVDTAEAAGLAAYPVRDQRSGASQACGYTRVSGLPSVLALSSGPSFLNSLAGVSEAASLGTPMVVVTTRVPTSGIGRGGFQDLDQRSVATPLVSWTYTVERPEDVGWALRRAVSLATSTRPSVTVVELTDEVIRADAPEPEPRVPGRAPRSSPCTDDLARAVDLMRSARRPLVVAGGGATGARDPLAELLARWGAAGATTSAGRGTIDEHAEMACGLVGLYATPPLHEVFASADVVLGVGTSWEETATMGWDGLQEARVIHVDRDITAFGRSLEPEVALHGDTALTVDALARLLGEGPVGTDPGWAPKVRSAVAQASGLLSLDFGTSRCAATLQAVQERLPQAFVLAQDNGLHDIWSYHFPLVRVGKGTTVVGPGEQTVMGHGLAAGVGASLADRERTTVAVMGDGAFSMSASALATAVEHGSRLLCVVFDNGGFGWPRLLRTVEGRSPEVTRFGERAAVSDLGRAYGAAVVTVDTAEDLFKGLDILLDGVHEGRPGLLHVLVDDHDVPPGVARIVGVSSPQASSRK